jgi:hypothetical protein
MPRLVVVYSNMHVRKNFVHGHMVYIIWKLYMVANEPSKRRVAHFMRHTTREIVFNDSICGR